MSIFDPPEAQRAVPMWRCPHCGTLQSEAASCWSCARSAVACGTCRAYRSALVGDVGFCGLDRDRRALAADEVRPCWLPPETPDDEWPGMLPASSTGVEPSSAARPIGPSSTQPAAPVATPRAGADSTEPERAPTRIGFDRLVEAPLVEPGRQLVSAAARRAALRRAQGSGEGDLD